MHKASAHDVHGRIESCHPPFDKAPLVITLLEISDKHPIDTADIQLYMVLASPSLPYTHLQRVAKLRVVSKIHNAVVCAERHRRGTRDKYTHPRPIRPISTRGLRRLAGLPTRKLIYGRRCAHEKVGTEIGLVFLRGFREIGTCSKRRLAD